METVIWGDLSYHILFLLPYYDLWYMFSIESHLPLIVVTKSFDITKGYINLLAGEDTGNGGNSTKIIWKNQGIVPKRKCQYVLYFCFFVL